MRKLTERFFNSDALRILAVLVMVTTHSFDYAGYFEQPIEGATSFFLVLLKTILMFSAPALLIGSAYLMSDREPNRRHYIKIIKTMFVYVITMVIGILIQKIWFGYNRGLLFTIARIFSFEGNSYAWFLKIYICLYLILPYLKKFFNSLDKKEQQFLLMILTVVVCLPALSSEIGNIFEYYFEYSSTYSGLYPILLSLIGFYLKEHGNKMKLSTSIIYLSIAFIVITVLDYIEFYDKIPHRYAGFTSFNPGSIQNLIVGTLIVMIINKIDFSKLNINVKKFISYVSKHTLGAMTLSFALELIVYLKILKTVPKPFPVGYFLLGVILIVVISNIAVIPIYELYDRTFAKIVDKFKMDDVKPSEKEKNKNY